MAANPITMDQIRIIIQQAHSGVSLRRIARDTGLSRNTVRGYLRQIEQSGHTLVQALALDDANLSVLVGNKTPPQRCIQNVPCTNAIPIVLGILPVNTWYNYLKDETLVDAILDRLTARANRIELTGESLRTKA